MAHRRLNNPNKNVYHACDLQDGRHCSPCQEYVVLDARITAAKKKLEALLAQRTQLRTKINHIHDPITRHFPPEITSLIFQFSLPENWDFVTANSIDNLEHQVDRSLRLGPLLFGSICRSWRNIAWASPPLWNAIWIHLEAHTNWLHFDIAREWLGRASQLPLSICISHRPRFIVNTLRPDGVLWNLVSIINERSSLWKNLVVVGSEWLSFHLRGDSQGAPNLRALRIYHNGRYNYITGDGRSQFSLIGPKPQPAQVSIDCRLKSIAIEWNHVTSVVASNICLDECIELLRRARQLAHCRFFSIKASTDSFPIPLQPIIHRALESLELDDNDRYGRGQGRQAMALINSFTFPSLAHLKLGNGVTEEDQNDQISWRPLVAHIARSSPPLVSLGIQICGPIPITKCLLPILRQIPLLRSLDMMTPFPNDSLEEGANFFYLLAATSLSKSTREIFLPNLQRINFHLDQRNNPDHFWTHVPIIFGPISSIHNPRRRPLNTLRVRAEMKPIGNMLDSITIKSEVTIQELLDLKREGITLDLEDAESMGFDILRISEQSIYLINLLAQPS